jgi:hypothetical protein
VSPADVECALASYEQAETPADSQQGARGDPAIHAYGQDADLSGWNLAQKPAARRVTTAQLA